MGRGGGDPLDLASPCACNKTSVLSYRFTRPSLPIPSNGKAGDLQMHPSHRGFFQHAFRYVCDISYHDWTCCPCGMYNMAWDLSWPARRGYYQDLRGGHSLRVNAPKGSCTDDST
ncbi:hypothetical protein F4819DRAFT_8904 [Hypoxylon fuscum]|nr:hypothetical protein F4819DRAFT_8904 [Hypoxylon fuscum]